MSSVSKISLPTGRRPNGLAGNTVYFHGNGTSVAWWALAAWAAGGLLVSYAASLRGRRAASAPT
ncbi:hypothetical protein [Streptantibioticus ferralitis]|uniref:hypothetical protein n=1 Tax=Streptantibioticus ferralitis TaxID=236510 RepID=UPI0027E38100|nr:hypothetical protein [Streptantibioticus ferralitis]